MADDSNATPALHPGVRISHYELVEVLGRGGMGEVWRARDVRLKRDVALKVLHEASGHGRQALAAIEREACAASALSHPNIVTIHEVDIESDIPFLAMELLDGPTLLTLLEEGPLPLKRALEIAAEVAEGLAGAHEAGLVHRDLKPANIVVTRSGIVKILDFGLAKKEVVSTANPSDSTLPQTMTSPGMLIGTVGYMSPEQAAGNRAESRSDQFALGVVLYEMLTGHRPFIRRTVAETLTAIIREEPDPPPSFPSQVDAPVRWILGRCLAKEPHGRYAATRDLARDLKDLAALVTGHSFRGAAPSSMALRAVLVHPKKTAAASLALVLAVALSAGFWAGSTFFEASLPQFRQVTFRRGTVWAARFTPGEENLVYGASWDGAPPQLFSTRVDGGASAQFFAPPGNLLAVSPASDLAVSLGAMPELPGMAVGTLARMPLAGGAPREILNDVEFADFLLQSQDFAVVRRVGGKARLEIPGKRVLFETPGWMSHPRVSPDGSRIAFLHHPSMPDDRGEVMVVPVDGGSPQVLSPGWTSTLGLAWDPSGREVWFTATGESGARVLHAVTLGGRLRTVFRMAGNQTLHDVSKEGKVLLSRDTMRIGLIRGQGDEAGSDLSWLDSSLVTDVSADGASFLFTEFGEGGGPRYAAYLRKSDGSPALRLGDGIATALSPDGRQVLVIVPGDPPVLTVIPTGAGETLTVDTAPVAGVAWAAWFPDGKSLLLVGSEAGKGMRLWRLVGMKSPARPLSAEGVTARFSGGVVSLDGKVVAAGTDEGGLVISEVRGEKPRHVPAAPPGFVPIGWSPDGLSLIGFLREGPSARLLRLNVEGGQSSGIRLLRPFDSAGVIGIPTVRTTPDGSVWLYSYGRMLSELYVVEGLK